MKVLKLIIPSIAVYFLLFTTGTQFSSCEKTVTVHDTIVKKDTVIHKDTLTIVDSLGALKTGMVGYYTFTNGSLQDSSGYNNHIVFNSAAKTADRYGRANNAYLFDGASTYMKVSNSASLSPANLTLAATVRVNGFYKGACQGNDIIVKGSPDDVIGLYLMRFTSATGCGNAPDTTKEFFFGGYGDNVPKGTSPAASADSVYIKTGQWYNLVYTYDGFESRFYINGVLKSITVKTAAFHANSNDLYFGKNENPQYPYYFNGAIDEIRIYNRALCADDVKMLNSLKQ